MPAMSSFVTRWLKLSLVVIMGCGFLAMMIYALVNRDEIRSSQVEPPLITAPTEPLKRRPDQPGGMQIPNRDKLVFDLLDSSNTTLGDTGVKMAKDVTPTVPVAEVVQTADDGEAVSGTMISATAVVAPAVVVTPTTVVPVVAVKPLVSATAVVKVVEVAPKVEPKVEVKKVEAVSAKTEAKPVEVKATGGKWGVQLAAVNTQADGNALAAKAGKDFAALKALTPKISPVPGAKKFRVQFVGLKDREAAAAVCAKLAGKQGCFPVSLQ
jgi:cell division septation protein DedD